MELTTDFLLFDLDGTLVDSTHAVEKTWQETVRLHNEQYPDQVIDPIQFLDSAHGSRTVETFKKWFPYRPNSVDAVKEFEGGIVTNYGTLAVEVPGALSLIGVLNKEFQNSWAIVTSGTHNLAHGWIETLFPSHQKPPVFVTADLVSKGKPDPEGYQKAYAELTSLNGVTNAKAIVFEDAPTGIKAGVNGGFVVIGITTTFPKETLIAAGATYVIKDLTKVKLTHYEDKIKLLVDIE